MKTNKKCLKTNARDIVVFNHWLIQGRIQANLFILSMGTPEMKKKAIDNLDKDKLILELYKFMSAETALFDFEACAKWILKNFKANKHQ